MKILFVSAVLPYPLHSGGQIRLYHLLQRLSKRHTITLASFIRSEDERAYAEKLAFCESVTMVMRGRAWQAKYYLKALFGKYPFLLSTYDNSVMRQHLARRMADQHYDLVHIEPFYVMPSLPDVRVPLVVSEHNIEHQVYERYVQRFPVPLLRPLLSRDIDKLTRWEHVAWQRAQACTAVSHEDARVMQETLHREIDIVPNGVDLQAFPYRDPPKRKATTLLFVGNFRWYPNRDAAYELIDHIWPHMHESIPEARVVIAGRDMPLALKDRVRSVGGEVCDAVDDIAKLYREADILIAPHAISGGTKFKMLEAMASGLPILTTKEGMFGLSATPDKHYFLAQTPQEFVLKVKYILDKPAVVKNVVKQARLLVETQYSWDQIALALERVWEEACTKK